MSYHHVVLIRPKQYSALLNCLTPSLKSLPKLYIWGYPVRNEVINSLQSLVSIGATKAGGTVSTLHAGQNLSFVSCILFVKNKARIANICQQMKCTLILMPLNTRQDSGIRALSNITWTNLLHAWPSRGPAPELYPQAVLWKGQSFFLLRAALPSPTLVVPLHIRFTAHQMSVTL